MGIWGLIRQAENTYKPVCENIRQSSVCMMVGRGLVLSRNSFRKPSIVRRRRDGCFSADFTRDKPNKEKSCLIEFVFFR